MTRIPPRPRVWGPLLSSAAAALLLGLAGCTGTPTGSVSGKVTYQGKAVRHGTVMFVGSNSLAAYGAIGDDGQYSIPKVAAGPAKITVSSPDPKGGGGRARKGDKDAPDVPIRGEEVRAEVKGWFPLPDEYGDLSRSKLTFEVKPGPNTHNIELK